jgi:hypothetical protein
MKPELDPKLVAERLSRLRALWFPKGSTRPALAWHVSDRDLESRPSR